MKSLRETNHAWGKSHLGPVLSHSPNLREMGQWRLETIIIKNDLPSFLHVPSVADGVARTDYAPITPDAEGINRVWRDLHGAVQSNAACFGDDIILITSHTG